MASWSESALTTTPVYSSKESTNVIKAGTKAPARSNPRTVKARNATKIMPLGAAKECMGNSLLEKTKFGMRRESFELVTVMIRLMLTTTAVVFAALFLVQNVVNYGQLQDVDKTFKLSSISLAAVAQVGRERGLSGGYISSSGASNGKQINAQRLVVDAHVKEFQDFVGANSFSSEVTNTIRAVQDMLSKLADHRAKVSALQISGADSLDWYSLLNFNFLSIGRKLPTVIYDTDMSNLMVAYIALGSVVEFAGIERGTFNTVLGARRFTGNTFERVVRAMQSQDMHFQTFQSYAPPDQIDTYFATVKGIDVNQTSTFQGYALASAYIQDIPAAYPGLTLDTWWTTRSAVIDLQIDVLDFSRAMLAAKADGVFSDNRRSLIFSVVGTFASTVSAIYLTVGAVVGWKRIKRVEEKRRSFFRKVEQRVSKTNLLTHPTPGPSAALQASFKNEDEDMIEVGQARPRTLEDKMQTLMSLYDEDLATCDSARDLNEAAMELDDATNATAPIWQSESKLQKNK